METVKEKIDNVRHGRKRSKELSASHLKTEASAADVNQEQLSHQLAEFTLETSEDQNARHQAYMQQQEDSLPKHNDQQSGINREPNQDQAQMSGEDELHPYSR